MKSVTSLVFFLLTGTVWADIQPADGLWTTTDDPANGSGLMLATQNGITVVSLFSYDEAGNNVWYVAAGQVDESGVLEATLRQNTNGSYILNDNPASAEFVETSRNLRLEFIGTQLGYMSIESSQTKMIRAQNFGYASNISIPDLSGKWVLADATNKKSVILDLESRPGGSITGFVSFLYVSSHPSSENWLINCTVNLSTPLQGFCSLTPDEDSSFSESFINFSDLGSQRLTTQNYDVEKYQAFRLNKDRHLLPNDGLWRPSDDPAIGSGLAMRTQGDYTVVLLYSYDEQGQPKWQIASGQFDENGLFSAALLTPEGGTAIESQSPLSAEFSSQVQTLEIQLLGLELATFSIDGSAPKYIQNYNFGVELYETKIYEPLDQPFVFPNQIDQWIMVDENKTLSSIWNIFSEDPNACQSPPDPLYSDSIGLSNGPSCYAQSEPIFDNPYFRVQINCIKTMPTVTNFEYPKFDFCYGYNYASDGEFRNLKINFSDIGFNQFRFYTGPDDPESYFDPFFEINRNSPMFQLFRLSN